MKNRLLLALSVLTAVALWVLPRIGNCFSPDSYGYALLGKSIWTHGSFASAAIRDYYGGASIPQLSRSFPPLWPFLLGGLDRMSSWGMFCSVALNLAALAITPLLMVALVRSEYSLFAFGTFFVLDPGYREEIAAGRSIPLAILLLLVLGFFVTRDSQNQTTRRFAHWFISGVLLGLLPLARFDQAAFAGLLGLFLMLRHRKTVSIWGLPMGMLLILGPWMLRNYLVFGAPLASDNSATALSLFPAIHGLSFFAPGHEPGTIHGHFISWLFQRVHYFAVNGFVILKTTFVAIAVTIALLPRAWKRLSPEAKRLAALLLLNGALTTLLVSMTPYHEARYFSSIHLTLWIGVAAAADALFPFHSNRLVQYAAVATASLGVLVGLYRIHLYGAGTWRNESIPGRAVQVAALEKLKQINPDLLLKKDAPLVATHAAEAFTWYTGVPSIYLPVNAEQDSADFLAWMEHYKPEFILAHEDWIHRMHLEAAAADHPLVIESGHRLLSFRAVARNIASQNGKTP